MSKILIEKKTFKKVFFHIIGGRMSFRLRLLNIKKIINLEIILMFNYNLTDRIRKKYVFSDQIEYLPFGTFMCCFGSSRKVGISLSLSEVLFDNISGKRISLSSRFVSLIVSSRIEKNQPTASVFVNIS